MNELPYAPRGQFLHPTREGRTHCLAVSQRESAPDGRDPVHGGVVGECATRPAQSYQHVLILALQTQEEWRAPTEDRSNAPSPEAPPDLPLEWTLGADQEDVDGHR